MKEDPLERLDREERERKERNTDLRKVMYVLIGVAALLAGALAYIWIQKSSLVKELEVEKEDLTEQIVALQGDYANLSSEYDTINSQLDSSREEVAQLVERIKKTEATNRAQMRQYEKELGTLRSIMRNYIVQIDSLNDLNHQLTVAAASARREAAESKARNKELTAQVEDLSGQILDLGGELLVAGLALSSLAACRSGGHGELMIEVVERVDLDDVVAHDAAQGAEFLLILAHLGAVRGLGLLDALDQLGDLLAGGIQLGIDRVIFRGEVGIIALEGDDLLRQVFLLHLELLDEAALLDPDIGQGAGQQRSHADEDVHDLAQVGVPFFPLSLFAVEPL